MENEVRFIKNKIIREATIHPNGFLIKNTINICSGLLYFSGQLSSNRFLTNYGADLGLPFVWYNALRITTSLKPSTIALIVFSLPTIFEIGQKLNIIPGVYDPKDIAAYGISVFGAYVLDKVLTPQLKK